MLCPKCKSKLYCQDSRPLDGSTTIRQMICLECKVVYLSIDKLDPKPFEDARIQKRFLRPK